MDPHEDGKTIPARPDRATDSLKRDALLLVAFLALLIGYYECLGPGPTPSEVSEDLPWWRPYGFAGSWEPLSGLRSPGGPLSVGSLALIGGLLLPAALLFFVGVRSFGSPLRRLVYAALAITTAIFVYYGTAAEPVWRFFEWRFPLVSLSFAALTATMLFAPSLLRTTARSSIASGIVLLGCVSVGIFLLSTEVTGTDSSMKFNISPWPTITLFGFLLIGSLLAVLHGAAGMGAWIARRMAGPGGPTLGAAVAAVSAATASYTIFRDPTAVAVIGLGTTAVLYAGVTHFLGPSGDAEARRDALWRFGAGAFLGLTIQLSNQAAIAFQVTARNETAAELLVALEAYRGQAGRYPDTLEQLVPDFLPVVPRPRIGFILHDDDRFHYTFFGESYALEFSSVQWVQCGYSPPFDETDPDPVSASEPDEVGSAPRSRPPENPEPTDHGLEGAWNCEQAPPRLW